MANDAATMIAAITAFASQSADSQHCMMRNGRAGRLIGQLTPIIDMKDRFCDAPWRTGYAGPS
ncbi:MAG: hypothetical protein R3D05_02460 [Dongiaceae bacterium]